MKEAIIQYNDDPNADGNHMVISWKELIRCKGCRYAAPDMACTHESEWGNEISRNRDNPYWFCADGEPKD